MKNLRTPTLPFLLPVLGLGLTLSSTGCGLSSLDVLSTSDAGPERATGDGATPGPDPAVDGGAVDGGAPTTPTTPATSACMSQGSTVVIPEVSTRERPLAFADFGLRSVLVETTNGDDPRYADLLALSDETITSRHRLDDSTQPYLYPGFGDEYRPWLLGVASSTDYDGSILALTMTRHIGTNGAAIRSSFGAGGTVFPGDYQPISIGDKHIGRAGVDYHDIHLPVYDHVDTPLRDFEVGENLQLYTYSSDDLLPSPAIRSYGDQEIALPRIVQGQDGRQYLTFLNWIDWPANPVIAALDEPASEFPFPPFMGCDLLDYDVAITTGLFVTVGRCSADRSEMLYITDRPTTTEFINLAPSGSGAPMSQVEIVGDFILVTQHEGQTPTVHVYNTNGHKLDELTVLDDSRTGAPVTLDTTWDGYRQELMIVSGHSSETAYVDRVSLVPSTCP